MARIAANGDVFEVQQEVVDVTSLHRPDPTWRHVDAAGHEHCWHVVRPTITMQVPGGPVHALAAGAEVAPAASYEPGASYDVPTLVFVQDGTEYWDGDDTPHAVGHLECRRCGERVVPGYTADTQRQLAAGLRRCFINGEPVDPAEFERRLAAAHGVQP